MKKTPILFLLALLCFAATQLRAQTDTAAKNQPTMSSHKGDEEVFTVVEQSAEPAYDLRGYLARNMQYPDSCKAKGQAGTAYVAFIVEKDGSISHVALLKGIRGAPALDAEALRLVKNMPPWNPAKMQGRNVRLHSSIPVRFVLQ